ncbi:hypothetical protein G5B39_03200 [Rhodobacteraceae bacterium SC52]|nr:hypothetical protein G5B39_03200 [Rhodobacteraceae bacterium SC52]
MADKLAGKRIVPVRAPTDLRGNRAKRVNFNPAFRVSVVQIHRPLVAVTLHRIEVETSFIIGPFDEVNDIGSA